MKAIFPGSFNPFTLGHLDILIKATKITSELIILVSQNPEKLKKSNQNIDNIQNQILNIINLSQYKTQMGSAKITIDILPTDQLLAEYTHNNNIQIIIRSMRSVIDFEYETKMAQMNLDLNPNCQTIFLTPSPKFQHIQSNLIRQIKDLNGNFEQFLP